MRKLIAACALAGGIALGLATATQAKDDKVDAALTPAEALAKPETSGEVVVRGTLKNAGTNYFTDSRLVLTGEDKQTAINVQPWLPSTAALPRSATPDAGELPPVQSDYLDKEVVLRGELKLKPVKGVGVTKVFIVKSAEIVPK